jgi:hypothetical protein
LEADGPDASLRLSRLLQNEAKWPGLVGALGSFGNSAMWVYKQLKRLKKKPAL